MLNIILVFLELLAKWILKQKAPIKRIDAQGHLFIQRVNSGGPEM